MGVPGCWYDVFNDCNNDEACRGRPQEQTYIRQTLEAAVSGCGGQTLTRMLAQHRKVTPALTYDAFDLTRSLGDAAMARPLPRLFLVRHGKSE